MLCRRLLETNGILDEKWKELDRLKIDYELMVKNLVEIEKKLVELGGRVFSGFWNKLARGWIYFIEGNESQNLRSVSQSCCTVPESKQRNVTN